MPPYPEQPIWRITVLARQICGPSPAKRREVLARLNYSNQGRAGRRFDEMLASGDVNPHLREHLPHALGVPRETVDQAIADTEQQQRDHRAAIAHWEDLRARAEFFPHVAVRVDIKQKRVPLVALAWFGDHWSRHIPVADDLPQRSEAEQIATVQAVIADYPNTERGERFEGFFRRAEGYIYRPAYDESWLFSPQGEFLGKHAGRICVGSAGGSVAARPVVNAAPPAGVEA